MRTLFRKWWVILLQGILLIILSFIFFNHPVGVLVVLSLWIGMLVTASGLIGLVAHFTMAKEEGENNSIWWNIMTLLLGLLMLSGLGFTMALITTIFGFWVVLTGVRLFQAGQLYRRAGGSGWIMMIAGILSVFAGFAVMFNIGTGAILISTLLGLQAMLAGIAFIVLAFVKRTVVNNVKEAMG